MRLEAKHMLPPPPNNSTTEEEYLIPGETRFSSRGKHAMTNVIQSKLNIITEREHTYRDLAKHEDTHIDADVEGAGLLVVGAVRKGKINGSLYIQTNISLLPQDSGTKRTLADHLRMSKAPGNEMSEKDKANAKSLEENGHYPELT